MRDFINRYTGRIDYVIYSVVGSIILGFILLILANKLGMGNEIYRIETLGGLVTGQLILIAFSLFIKRKFMNDSK